MIMTLKCTYPAQIALLNSSFFYQLFITFSLRYFTNFSNLFYPEGISWVLLISRFRALYRRCYFLCLFLILSFCKILLSWIGFSLLPNLWSILLWRWFSFEHFSQATIIVHISLFHYILSCIFLSKLHGARFL